VWGLTQASDWYAEHHVAAYTPIMTFLPDQLFWSVSTVEARPPTLRRREGCVVSAGQTAKSYHRRISSHSRELA